jgi:GNAT superfamily N-acetyltransferase
MLSTHPEHQRRGAGSMLVKWGTDIADNLGLKAFVQASRLGKHLYESHGFVDKEGWITVPVSEKHSSKPEVAWFNLERPAKASIIPEGKNMV